MQLHGITYHLLADASLIPTQFQLIWSGLVIDTRTADKVTMLTRFAEDLELWGDFNGNLGPGSDAVLDMGTALGDRMNGTDGANDYMLGGMGADYMAGKGGLDFLIGGDGNDTINLGDGYYNRARGGDGGDVIFGGRGMDFVHGNDGNDRITLKGGDDKAYGGDGNDTLRGGGGDDWLQGAAGRDRLYGGKGDDVMHGGDDNDVIVDQDGRDWLDGGAGNDKLIVRSDAGIPTEKAANQDISSLDFNQWTDRLTGGAGADEFRFIYEMNATDAVAARNLNPDGSVNWMTVMRENANPHDHWVDWGGLDKIDDFSFAEGDKIVIVGHTVDAYVIHLDTDNDGIDDSSLITVYSDQASQMAAMGMGGMPMAHDGDLLGNILVEGALIDVSDLRLRPASMEAAFDTL